MTRLLAPGIALRARPRGDHATSARRPAPFRCPPLPHLPSARVLWALFAALALLWFVNLDARRLVHPDEGRYAEIAREMVVDRRLGDAAPQRPQVLREAAVPVLGDRRAPTGRSASTSGRRGCGPRSRGSSACCAIGYAGFALGGATLGAFAGLALAGTLWHAGIAQIVTLDSGTLVLSRARIRRLRRSRSGPRRAPAQRRAWMWVAWAAMAGATLSKGLIGIVLPGGALVAYTAITRDFALWRRLHLGVGPRALPRADRAVVRRRRARERRVPPVLLRPRALPALPHHRAQAHRPVVLLRPALRRRHPAVADRAGATAPRARGATARPTRSASRGSASRSSGRRSSSCSSARRARSCRRTSCRCSRRWRSSSAGCWCGSTPRTLFRLTLPLVVAGSRAVARTACSPTIATRRASRRARMPVGVLLAFGAWLKAGAAVAAAGGVVALVAFRRGAARTDGAVLGRRRCCRSTRSARCRSRSPASTRSARCARPRLSCGRRRRRRPSPPTRPSTRLTCTTRPSRSTSAARRGSSPSATSSSLGIDAEPAKQIPTTDGVDRRMAAASRRATR